MATFVTNEYLLNEMKNANPNLKCILYNSSLDTISLNGSTISLKNLPLTEIYNKFSQLKSDIEVITPVDLFNIIFLNSAVKEKNDNLYNKEHPKKYSQAIIKNIKIVRQLNNDGSTKQYANIIYDNEKEHIVFDYEPSEVLNALKTITNNGTENKEVSEIELFTELEKQSKINNSDSDIIKIDIDRLITPKEYFSILENNLLNKEDLDKKNYFEKFISNLHMYKSYLCIDALAMWNEYEQYIIVSNALGDNSSNLEKAIDYYNSLDEISTQVEFKNAESKTLLLSYQEEQERRKAIKENRAGVASALLIVEITAFISIALATVLFILLKN